MDDITASIIVQCQTSGAATSINKLGFSLAMLGKKAFEFGVQAVQEFRGTQDAAWKFGKTFSTVMGSAEKAVQDFMDSYNLSEKTARSMLTDTAQVLKGFGFDEKEALKLSEQVSRMGVDMASFTGYAGGAKGAVEAITAGMLGETERLKGLGTVIRMDSDEFRNLTKEMMQSKGVSEQQARAMATLELVMRKNKDAIGDYAAEGENFTQSVNNIAESFTQLKSDIGEAIYEVLNVNGIFTSLGDWLKNLSKNWSSVKDEWIFAMRMVAIEVTTLGKIVWGVIDPIWTSFTAGIKNIVTLGQWLYDNWSKIWLNIGDIMKSVILDWWEFVKYWFGSVVFGAYKALGEALAAALKAGLSGKDIGEAFINEFKNYGNDLIAGFAKQGKYTEAALKKAGASPLPEMQAGNWDFMGNIDKAMSWRDNAISDAEKRLAEKNKNYQDKKTPPPVAPEASIVANWGELAKEFAKIRQTSQGAVLANSMEGVRLQSRQLLSPTSGDPQKQSAQSLATLTTQGKEILKKMDVAIAAVVGTNANTMALAGVAGTKKF